MTSQLILTSELRIPRVIIPETWTTPRSDYGLPHKYPNLNQNANLKHRDFAEAREKSRDWKICCK